MNVLFDLAYPSKTIWPSTNLHRLNLNDFVHSVLQTIFDASGLLNANFPRRKITFTSFCPDVCSALNWKQPNCTPHVTLTAICYDVDFFQIPSFWARYVVEGMIGCRPRRLQGPGKTIDEYLVSGPRSNLRRQTTY